jgi:hypothetical protein
MLLLFCPIWRSPGSTVVLLLLILYAAARIAATALSVLALFSWMPWLGPTIDFELLFLVFLTLAFLIAFITFC